MKAAPINDAIIVAVEAHPGRVLHQPLEMPFYHGGQQMIGYTRPDAFGPIGQVAAIFCIRGAIPPLLGITGGIFEFGLTDTIKQIWAAFVDELPGGDAKGWSCAAPPRLLRMTPR